ncbi:SusD/RagB family nutrient-binding outer membrane lipoprotein [Marinifilum flexuosum]|uniref:SusD-like starch-binding protein associating with outer membrane n=1 Tax=Marinifilum flexuosum TaxID=1117708 RepID=A0A419X928_9BACT|nr:SusD/RagB family nutrient-binding outer membrane lipoprotein [Marinifilum flexuosum]RKE04241.1 SusD-like starch-binding protein associating with outer membrane [Marinifilum flexuosum]
MKKYIYKLSILFLAVAMVGCSNLDDELEKINIDSKNPSEVPGEPLFTNGARDMFDLLLGTNVNSNVFRLYSQYWAQTTYPDESQYNQVTRNIPDNMWRTLYRNTLKDITGAREIISQQETVTASEEAIKNNKLAVITIVETFAYATLVDIFGNVPFTEALDVNNVSPSYDDAATVYSTIIGNLNTAISAITQSEVGFANQDPIYEGDMAMWYKMANSLKLRLAMRLADVNASTAQTMAEEAAANVISSNSENFSIAYTNSSPNTHPLWVDLVQSGRNDFVPSNVLTGVMNGYSDPRMLKYFTQQEFEYDKDDNGDNIDTEIEGSGSLLLVFEDVDGMDSLVSVNLPYTVLAADDYEFGYFTGGVYGSANAASGFSQIGDFFKEPDLQGTLLSYAEVEFLLAEAAARGYSVGGTEESHYEAGIRASMDEFGIGNIYVDAYLLEPDVAYATAAGDWKQKIGTQKWIAMYNIPFEGWTTWRLLDFTGIFQAPEGLTLGDIPVRFIYPIEEATLNGAQYDAAASAIGGDLKSTKLFWDVN